MKVGYVGLGAMGKPLAQRLLGSAYELCVWDLNAEACADLEAQGASVATTALHMARTCDVVLLCLPKTDHVRQVLFGPGGLAEGLTPGKLVIDQTSGVPEQTRELARRLAEQGVDLIDAPVAGGLAAAQAGQVAIMMSGSPDACRKADPVLRTISANVFRCGERVGDGQAMKLVNNVMNAACRLATLEVVAMGRKMGLSLATLINVLDKSTARNRITVNMLPAINEGRSATNFALPLMVKDVQQAVALGMQIGAPMPIGSIALALLQTGVNTLGEQARLEDVVGLIESMNGVRLRDDSATSASTGTPTPGTTGADSRVVGYVGLGAMGAALVKRLLLSRKVHVYDTMPERVRALEAAGAIVAPDLPALARACDVIMICVPDSAVVRKVIFGNGGLGAGLRAGQLVIDQTTSHPLETRRIAEELQALGVAMVDAPVSGGPKGAAAGTVAIICGGVPQAFAQARPILDSISSQVIYCGDTGNGHVAKIVKNALGACNRLIAYESVALGAKVGLKLADMEQVINKGSGWSATFERIMPVLRAGGESAVLRLELMAKDNHLAADLGMSCGAPMLIANAVRSVVEAGVNELGPDINIDGLSRLYESRAGIRFGDA